ncbi:hypothetical protein Acr_00g0044410 [Actinidia rufa]|uniref:CCHC-type domain-containing protein n=1 Tax=Actinidia rufa TaxID=165716 RepID=A0A7J0DIW7_9ERIC|nr:hypothetical protein Acr_00g0044410 [Actinidia rufa]
MPSRKGQGRRGAAEPEDRVDCIERILEGLVQVVHDVHNNNNHDEAPQQPDMPLTLCRRNLARREGFKLDYDGTSRLRWKYCGYLLIRSRACYGCGQEGHQIRDCPMKSKIQGAGTSASALIQQPPAERRNNQPRQGRAFALVPGNTPATTSVVSGILPICGQPARILMDSVSTIHLFQILLEYYLTTSPVPLEYELLVSLPSGDSMLCDRVYILIRLPNKGENITSTRPGEVAFYEAAFPAGLRFPFHSTIRTLFSLNSNPKPDQGWLYFKARNKKVLLGGYPSNVKGWKSFLGETNEFVTLFTLSAEPSIINMVIEAQQQDVEPRRFAIVLLEFDFSAFDLFAYVAESWFDRGVTRASSSSSPATNGRFLKGRLGRAPQEFRGRGEFQVVLGRRRRGRRAIIFRAEKLRAPQAMWNRTKEVVTSYPQPDPFEVDDSKVLDPILDRFLNAPSSNPSSESCSDSSLPVELESDAMSKRVSFKKDRREARERASITSSPSKKGKADDGLKGKGVESGPDSKKKATSSSKASAAPTIAPSRPGEGTSAHLGTVRPPFYLGHPVCGREVAAGGDSPSRQGEARTSLTLDQTETKLFHVIGQALVLGSSLAIRSREAGEQASLQEVRVASMQANDELAKMKSDLGLLTDKLEKSGLLVNELREALNKAKDSVVEEFKSSSEIMVAVEDSASKYFGEGFDFCKVQLRRHHPNLAIDLEGTVVDQDLLAEQDEAAEEREKRNLGGTRRPLKQILQRPDTSGRLLKWSIELRLVIQTPSGEQMEYTIRIGFKATNNEAEYEALFISLRVAVELGAQSLEIFSDSQLVVNQVQGDYLAKDAKNDGLCWASLKSCISKDQGIQNPPNPPGRK